MRGLANAFNATIVPPLHPACFLREAFVSAKNVLPNHHHKAKRRVFALQKDHAHA